MGIGQSKLGSFVESWVNVAVGFGINYLGNLFILPLFGLAMTPTKAFGIGIVFTFISVARSYTLRRIFNRHTEKQA
jgi:hypothetical protein